MMNAKEYLSQYLYLKRRQRALIQELNDKRDRLCFLPGIDYSRDRVQTSPSADSQFRAIDELVDENREAITVIREYERKMSLISTQIRGMEKDLFFRILYERYINGKSMKEISSDMGYSLMYIQNSHGIALREFAKKYELLNYIE